MSRIAARVLMVGLLSLPMAPLAFGSAYPLAPNEPDFSASNLTSTFNGTNLTLTGSSVLMPDNSVLPGGAVTTLIDVPGTDCNPVACLLSGPPPIALAFTADATGFSIYGQSFEDYTNGVSDTVATATTYLSGTYISGSYINAGGGEYGEKFDVTFDNVAEMNLLEENFPSVIGVLPATNWINDTVVFDFDADAADGDMEPFVATPEPATLTLLCTGLAAGLLRKRRARKKA